MILTVRLKQHTPIIHFQHDQKGATLRATELKPKLDRFLKEKLQNNNAFKKYFAEKGNLPYKVNIIATGNRIHQLNFIEKNITKDGRDKTIPFPSFFGNVGSAKKKKFVFYKDLEIRFFSFHEEVIKAIKDNICEFFFLTNFGSRQSKGFGSFYVVQNDAAYNEPSSFNSYSSFNVQTANSTDTYDKYKELFNNIDLFYRTLRSGVNLKKGDRTEFYFKSLLFLYAKDKKWTWDKKVIKSKFINNESENGYIVRDLLGVASSQKYTKPKSFMVQYDENNEIQRYKSPITFKPIETNNGTFTVYLIVSPVNKGIFGKNFKIHKTMKDKKNNPPKIIDSLDIATPPKKDSFDIKQFLECALSVDLDNHVDKKFHKHNNLKLIKAVYEDLRKNANRKP